MNLGNFHLEQNKPFSNYQEGKRCIEKALEIIHKDSIAMEAFCYQRIGDFGRFTYDRIIALEYYKKAENLYFSLGNNYKVAECIHRTADVLGSNERWPLVIEQYERAIEFYQKAGATTRVASCTANIGEVNVNMGNDSIGLIKLKKAIEINKQGEHDLRIEAFFKFEIGRITIDSPEVKNRDQPILEALNTLEEIDYIDGIAYGNILLAQLYYYDKDYTKAKMYGEKGLKLALQYGHKLKINDAYKILFQISEKQKDYKSALNYHIELKHTNDSLQQEKTLAFLSEAQTKYEVEKKNNTILTIENENKQIAAQKEAAYNQRNIIIVFVIILSALVIALIVFQIKLRRSNKNLVEQKEVIQEVNYELEKTVNYKDVLLKEVHHRVKNNLQVICSILEMQADSSDSNKLKDKLQTSMDRVFSMALVHEQLYSNDTNEFINAHEYLHEIVNAVVSSQQNIAKNVALKLDIGEVKLALNIALPLGMILNELISNAFKYAFITPHKGVLKLSLKQKDATVIICLSDNGPGIDLDNKREKSIGLQIAHDFVYQLKGELKTFNQQGTNYELHIPLRIKT